MADSDRVKADDPPWLKVAFEELDLQVKEKPGAATNQRIAQYLQSTRESSPGHESDETHWCSAFVNFCIEKSTGSQGTNDLAARSWLGWSDGKRLSNDRPTRGCIVVFARPSGGPRSGHVAFYLSGSPQNGIRVLGGNQSNAVSIATQPLPFLAYLVPKEVDLTKDELLDALESDRGQRALREAVVHVLRVATGRDDASQPASEWFNEVKANVRDIKAKVT
jgi:uncharacterized protein (TIGR02594 family)